jgi:hypothetical protein
VPGSLSRRCLRLAVTDDANSVRFSRDISESIRTPLVGVGMSAHHPHPVHAIGCALRNRGRLLVAFTGIGAEVFCELVRHIHKSISIGRRWLLLGDVGPNLRILTVQVEPTLSIRVRVRLDRVDWALRFAHPAIDALVGMYDEHVLAFVEAVHGANLDAVGVFAPDAGFVDDVSHMDILEQNGQLVEANRI